MADIERFWRDSKGKMHPSEKGNWVRYPEHLEAVNDRQELSAICDEHAEALLKLGDAVYGSPWTSAMTLVEQAIKRFDGGMARAALARPCGQLEGAVMAIKATSEPVYEPRLIDLLGEVIGQLRVIRGLPKYPAEEGDS